MLSKMGKALLFVVAALAFGFGTRSLMQILSSEKSSQMSEPHSPPPAASILFDPRFEAVIHRAENHDRGARTEILEWLNGTDPTRRRAAVSALANFPDQESLAIEKRLLSDADPVIRGLALSTLSSQNSPQVVTWVEEAIRRPDATLNEKLRGCSTIFELAGKGSKKGKKSPSWDYCFQFLLNETLDTNSKYSSMAGWALFRNAPERPEVREMAIQTIEKKRTGPLRHLILSYLARTRDPWLKASLSKLDPKEQEIVRESSPGK